MVNVCFATNRDVAAPGADGVPDFGIVPAARTTYAVAEVDVIADDVDRGTITRIRDQNVGGFSAAAEGELRGAASTILVFIHGAANSFKDGIKRAAFLQPWYAASGIAGASATIVAFSWPSQSYEVSQHLDATIPQWLLESYRQDRADAVASGDAIAAFAAELARLFGGRPASQRMVLLCHSMGNYAFAGSVARIAALVGPRARPLFDRVILAAPDEIDTSFAPGPATRLGRLDASLAGAISVYWNHGDVLMYLSVIANHVQPLGMSGPDHARDTAAFPPARFDLVNCSAVIDYRLTIKPDATHQYYRLSRVVRNDIAAGIAGVPAAGRISQGGAVSLLRPL